MKKHTKILLALGSIATSVAAIPLVAAGCVKTKKPEIKPEDPKKPEGEKPGTTPEDPKKPEGEKPGTTPEVKPEDNRSEEQKEIDNWIETIKDQFEFSPYNKEEVLKSLKDKTGTLVYSYKSHSIVLKDNNDNKVNWSNIVFSPKDESLFSQYQLANPTNPTYYNKKFKNNSISGFIDYELKDNKITLKFKGAKFVAKKDPIIGTKIVSNEIDLSETQLDKIIKDLKFDIKDKNKEINKLTADDVKLEGNLNGANINSYNFAAKKGDETTLVLTAKISKNSVTQTIVKEIKGFKKQETKPETKKEDEELDPKVKLINKTIEKNKDLFTFKVWDESKKQEVIEKLTKKEAKLFYLGNHNIIIEFDKQEHDKALTQVVFEGKSGAFWSFGRVQLVNHLHHYKDEKVAKDKLELSNCLEYEVKDNKITITWAGGQKDNGVEPFIFGTKTGSQTIELK
ncbi:variable surface lipoprotein [Metamycoplasma hominis]|uniref:variable surface lipoprotein n=1 Tax=Metamycoplasma hominis TaxID=2098 RepID=UPI00158F63B0|nr:variable surface lipoprotein [Metamycoplasma hominis]QKX38326.1 variable surface lipoprotein [Metamycoplasma hominis]QKX39983.1 variable surface lipoprotein [Metamycoplasma hominis]